jgi:Flp pilus assembly protein TadD
MYYPYSHKAQKKVFGIVSTLFILSLVAFQPILFANTLEDTAEDYRLQGFNEQQKGHLDEALVFYQKALSLGLENAVLLNDLGVIFEQLGDVVQARIHYLRSITANPNYLPPLTNLAYLYQAAGDKESAVRYFEERYLKAPEDDPWKQLVKEELLRINPHYGDNIIKKEAEQLDSELVTQAHNEFALQIMRAENHYRRGQEYLAQNLYTEARTEFDRALSLTPNNPKVVEAQKRADYTEALEHIKGQANAAILDLQEGNITSAKEKFQDILATFPKEPIQQ